MNLTHKVTTSLGREARELHTGDIVNIPAKVKQRHGAAPDSWFSHLAVEIEGEEGSTEWCEAVSDEEYNTDIRAVT